MAWIPMHDLSLMNWRLLFFLRIIFLLVEEDEARR